MKTKKHKRKAKKHKRVLTPGERNALNDCGDMRRYHDHTKPHAAERGLTEL